MKKINTTIVLFTIFIFIVPFANAWKWETHQYLAEKICNQIQDCVVDCIKNGSITPDKDFKDFVNHHFYRECKTVNAEWCSGGECQDCSQGFITDDITSRKYVYWLLKARDEKDLCVKSYNLGVASHYFFDSKVFFHQTRGESETAHSGFETMVQNHLGEDNWSDCFYEICLNSSSFEQWTNEFLNETSRINNSSVVKYYVVESGGKVTIIQKIISHLNYYWYSLRRIFE